ncbi:MAG: MarR family transcriptional regulator [Colwellia sp.]|nr:MarR family transcriptional regulator [Colwellia sp.]MCW9081355.1 MarR family transcriptional regulator [Colwellia sp.]
MSQEFDRQTSAGWLLAALADHSAKKLDAELKQHGLSIALWPTLMCLWEQEGLTQRDIAEISKVRTSTTTRTLDKLERLGLAERKPDPDSRRSFKIFLTNKSRALKNVLTEIPIKINNELLSSLDDAEQKEAIRLLQKLLAPL